MSEAAPGERDPGLQPERTRLAWRRTTLSMTVAAVLAMRTTLHEGPTTPALLACALCVTLWLAFLLLAHHRIRTLTAAPHPAPLLPRHAATATACTVALAVCAAALIL